MNRSQSKSSKNHQRSRSKSTRRYQSKKSEKKSKSTSRNIQAMDNGDKICFCIPSSAIYFQNLAKNARMIEETPMHESSRIDEDEEPLHESLFEGNDTSILEVEDNSGNSSLLGYHYRTNSFR
ncbi:hypothetical protein PVAND_000867 [Polypedilum vanderplanki]|uniref:Uncharacterized protein n=1 Tax=Polypedilum vanderplanki TaxID=319348 RepID=A0A9J6BLH3_POLVA|nr:hypothetical protein PVAND_000867 [Polypedilum vanderplanki]